MKKPPSDRSHHWEVGPERKRGTLETLREVHISKTKRTLLPSSFSGKRRRGGVYESGKILAHIYFLSKKPPNFSFGGRARLCACESSSSARLRRLEGVLRSNPFPFWGITSSTIARCAGLRPSCWRRWCRSERGSCR